MPSYTSDTSIRLLESNKMSASGHPTHSQFLGKRQVDTGVRGRVEENRTNCMRVRDRTHHVRISCRWKDSS